jgi:hypothetical protein
MNFQQLQGLAEFVQGNSAHECGHMTVQFKTDRFAVLNFLPHDAAADGVKGVLESSTKTRQLTAEDCVALAAGMIGELILLGEYDPDRLLDDRQQVQRLVGQPLENFALEAYEIIKQNLLFFVLLNIEVRKKMFTDLEQAYSMPSEDFAKLPNEVPIFRLAEVEQVYKRAESILAGFPGKTVAP